MAREATSDEVKDLRAKARGLKEVLAKAMLANRLFKKAWSRIGTKTHEIFRFRETRNQPPAALRKFDVQSDVLTWLFPLVGNNA